MVDTVAEYWSRDEENFSYGSLQELLGTHDDIEAGDTVYHGEGIAHDPAEWVGADDVTEQLSCRAYDACGEFAEDYPEVSREAKAELDELLAAWVRKHCTPTFYAIKNVREYEVTAEDIAEANGTTNTTTGATTVSLETPLDKDPPAAADSASGRTESEVAG